VAVLQPGLLFGTTVGVALNPVFPGWLIVLVLIVVLTYIVVRTSRGVRES